MKCPLCDSDIDNLVGHLDDSHALMYECEKCKIKTQPFSSLIRHYHSDEHLWRTGKLQAKIKTLENETTILKDKLSKQIKKTIDAEADKIEILQAGHAMR